VAYVESVQRPARLSEESGQGLHAGEVVAGPSSSLPLVGATPTANPPSPRVSCGQAGPDIPGGSDPGPLLPFGALLVASPASPRAPPLGVDASKIAASVQPFSPGVKPAPAWPLPSLLTAVKPSLDWTLPNPNLPRVLEADSEWEEG
jgi:hypothetical protein